MAKLLLEKVIRGEIELNKLKQWLGGGIKKENSEFIEIKCLPNEFNTYFLNLFHEELPKIGGKKTTMQNNCTKTNTTGTLDCTSKPPNLETPKISRYHYNNPTSPLYRSGSGASKTFPVTTPPSGGVHHRLHNHNRSLNFGDFITDQSMVTTPRRQKPVNKNKYTQKQQRRITPTKLMHTNGVSNAGVYNINSSFDFSQNNNTEDLTTNIPNQRHLLAVECSRIAESTTSPTSTSAQCILETPEIFLNMDSLTNRDSLDKYLKIYEFIIENSDFIVNAISECRFFVLILVRRYIRYCETQQSGDGDINMVDVRNGADCVYIAANALGTIHWSVLMEFDNVTLRTLCMNQRFLDFAPPDVVSKLKEVVLKRNKGDVDHSNNSTRDFTNTSVAGGCGDVFCFNLDRDHRRTFLTDRSFHAFRKQRDLFYELLRLWENSVGSGDFTGSFGVRVRALLMLHHDPVNYVHFACLFRDILVRACALDDGLNNNGEIGNSVESGGDEIVALLPAMDRKKLSRLKTRLVSRKSESGSHFPSSSIGVFGGRQEFFRDFIVTAESFVLNRHLCDAFITEIYELNEVCFSGTGETVPEISVDVATKKTFNTSVKSLRVLAKFLGFIDSLPYKCDIINISNESIVLNQLELRKKISPNFDVLSLLKKSLNTNSAVLTIPWIVEYLYQLDNITLRTTYYATTLETLRKLHKTFSTPIHRNVAFVKHLIESLFDGPHINSHINISAQTRLQNTNSNFANHKNDKGYNLDFLNIIDWSLFECCIPILNDIKNMLVSHQQQQQQQHNQQSLTRHITPVTSARSQTSELEKVHRRLEAAFFNSQPSHVRKTVDFIADRIVGVCVQNICVKYTAAEYTKNIIKENRRKENSVVDTGFLSDLKARCEREAYVMCKERVHGALSALFGPEIDEKVLEVCVSITQRMCIERIDEWIRININFALFEKELQASNSNQNLVEVGTTSRVKNDEKTFTSLKNHIILPKHQHNENTLNSFEILSKLNETCCDLLKSDQTITQSDFQHILNEILTTLEKRNDINENIYTLICALLTDISILLIVHNADFFLENSTFPLLTEIWEKKSGITKFKSILSLRNFRLMSRSHNPSKTLCNFSKFCVRLIRAKLVSLECFEEQCAGIFRFELDEKTLQNVVQFLKTFLQDYTAEGGGYKDEMATLLSFLSDYCDDLF